MGKQYLNGVLYGTGEIIKFSPEIYSLEEREVGVWTDGKPLYQKTWILTVPNSTGLYSYTNAVVPNLEKVVRIAYSIGTASGEPVGEVGYTTWASGTATVLFSGQDATLVQFYFGGTYFSGGKLLYTSQYTKTTDLPNSGKYTTDGTLAHHYSTTEQVIGTWIDGSTLYESVVTGLNITFPNNYSWTDAFATSLGIADIVDVKLYDTSGVGYPIKLSIDEIQAYNGGIRVRTSVSNLITYRTITRAVIQYTKTT